MTKACIVAHSGGGPIAVQLAVDAPSIARSLVLIEPALQTAAMAADLDTRVAPLIELCHDGRGDEAVDLWMRAVGRPDWQATLGMHLGDVVERAHADAVATFDGDLVALRGWDFDDVRALIAPPTLYMVGSISAPAVERATRMFCDAVPDAELVTIDGADHSLPITHAGHVATAIADFLDRHPKAGETVPCP